MPVQDPPIEPSTTRALRRPAWIIPGLLCVLPFFGCQDADHLTARVPVHHDRAEGAGAARDAAQSARQVPGVMTSILDPRMAPLLRAADRWQRSHGPERQVVDQVYLVPDIASFFEIIETWDEQTYFPILIDDPVWTLPFLRVFRPARVVRVAVNRQRAEGVPEPEPQPPSLEDRWRDAQLAVARAWGGASMAENRAASAHRVPAALGSTPPGLVLSDPASPALAGAVALAAGRFQPLVRLEPIAQETASQTSSGAAGPKGFRDVLSLNEACEFARRIEACAASITGDYGRLGDQCDFLTLAGEWPYRYTNDTEGGILRGEYALDDLIGRLPDTADAGLARARRRWAFVGRLLGDASASVYRAMCSLFLQPGAAVLWDTYQGGRLWSDYRMTEAAQVFSKHWPWSAPLVHRSAGAANLSAWHEAFDPVNRFGWIMVNSSGAPGQFSIPGGTGLPADLPRGRPAAVTIIHSFSAADPLDPTTIAGRWLDNGAFVYFGSMNEPYLVAFRCPELVAQLAALEVPLSAVLRQGEFEPFGRPWRLVYLGDPLYQIRRPALEPGRNRVAPDPGPVPRPPGRRWRARVISAGRSQLRASRPGGTRAVVPGFGPGRAVQDRRLGARLGSKRSGPVRDSVEHRSPGCRPGLAARS